MAMKKNIIKLVYFEDSITFGEGVKENQKWYYLLNEALKREYWNQPVQIQGFCEGVSGETSRMGLLRMHTSLFRWGGADVIMIQFGMNDCNFWETDSGLPRVSPASFVANLKEMIARCRHWGIEEIILQTNHPTLRNKIMANSKSYEENNQEYNGLIRMAVRDLKVTLLDIHDQFVKTLKQNSDLKLNELLLPYPDLLHLSEKGHYVYFQCVKEGVGKAVKKMIHPQEQNRAIDT